MDVSQPPREATDHMWRRGARLILRSLRAYPHLHGLAMTGALGFVAASIGGAVVLGSVTDDVVLPAFEDGTIDRVDVWACLLYTSPSPRDLSTSRMPSSA